MSNPFTLIRLALLGSRGGWGRPAGVVLGTALGMAMLVLLLGAFHGLGQREARSAWLNTLGVPLADRAALGLLMVRGLDHFGALVIRRMDVAQGAQPGPAIPGVGKAPDPGTFVASPALATLIAAHPNEQLADRYGELVGLIDTWALLGPDALAVVVGQSPQELAAYGPSRIVDAFEGRPASDSASVRVVMLIGAVGLFFPVVVFVAITTRLGEAQRRENLATLRLIGASRIQLALMSAAEMLMLCGCGAALGIGIAALLRPIAAQVPLNGGRFFADDLALDPLLLLVMWAGLVLLAGIAAFGIAWRSGPGPLGASRQQCETPPRLRRAVPLVLGLGALAASAALGDAQGAMLVAGFTLCAVGIVTIGPLLTLWASRLAARWAATAAGVIAANRLCNAPVAIFRAVSGLVIAVFMVSVFTSVAGGVLAGMRIADTPGRLPADALLAVLPEGASAADLARSGLAPLAIAYRAQGSDAGSGMAVIAAADAAIFGLEPISGHDWLAFPVAAYIAAGAQPDTVLVPVGWQADSVPVPGLAVIRTDGSLAGMEGARTRMHSMGLSGYGPLARADFAQAGANRLLAELAFVAHIGVLVSMLIAGCSLSVSTLAAMLDRKRILGLLRIMGMSPGQMRGVVIYEAALPLGAVLLFSGAMGFLVAQLIAGSLSDSIVAAPPDMTYMVVVAGGLAMALALVASSFPLVQRLGATVTRFE